MTVSYADRRLGVKTGHFSSRYRQFAVNFDEFTRSNSTKSTGFPQFRPAHRRFEGADNAPDSSCDAKCTFPNVFCHKFVETQDVLASNLTTTIFRATLFRG